MEKFDKWRVAPSNTGKPYLKILGTSLGYKYRIAEVPFLTREEAKSDFIFDRFKTEAEQHANLIAAAPLLLEALQDLLKQCKRESEFFDTEEAEQAINKALGNEN